MPNEGLYLLSVLPGICKGPENIPLRISERIVRRTDARKLRQAARRGLSEGEQPYNVARVRVEDLVSGGVTLEYDRWS